MTNRIRREPGRRKRDSRGTTAKRAPRADTRAYRSSLLKTIRNPAILNPAAGTAEGITEVRRQGALLKTGALQNAILNFPAVVSVTALRDAQNAIIGYLLIGTDNTARKQVDAEQKKLDQRLRDQQFYTRSLIESNIDALMTTDPSGIITDVNRQIYPVHGGDADTLMKSADVALYEAKRAGKNAYRISERSDLPAVARS